MSPVLERSFTRKHKPTINTEANKGSVKPEKESAKFIGANNNNTGTNQLFFMFNLLAIKYAANIDRIVLIQLNSFIPINPNWAKGVASATYKGLAQGSRKLAGWFIANLANR